MNIVICTHTGSDLPLADAASLGIKVLPDLVVFGDRTYRNMLDISPDEFYTKLKKSGELPTSSHPSIGEFCNFFRENAQNADEILFLSITSKMSGSYMTAVSARDALKQEGISVPVYVYDTLQCSHGMAIMVREAAKLASAGLTSPEIMSELDRYREKIGVYFILDSLKYARKGGRVGAIKALAADTMGIKPLLIFDNGLVRDIGIARNFDDGLQKVLSKFEAEADFSQPVTVFHQAARSKAETLAAAILKRHINAAIQIEEVGPVIGIYTGPGGAGLAFVKK